MTRTLLGLMAALSLLAVLVAPFLYLRQAIGEAEFKNALLAASVAWFVFGGLWVRRAGRNGG
jgi:ABC-type uncharacterized transport system permease subunit